MQQLAILEAGSALRFRLEGDYTADDIGAAVEGLIELLDKRFAPYDPDEPIFAGYESIECDPDFSPRSDGLPGDPDDAEPDEDLEAGAYVEWHSMTPAQRKAGKELAPSGNCALGFGSHEDDEDGDPAEDDDSDRCSAGEDHLIGGAVAMLEFYAPRDGYRIGSDEDAEEGGDVELNGDELDYTEGLPHWER